MKKVALVIALAAVGFVGCDKLENLTQFTVPIGYTTEVDLKGLPDTLQQHFPPQGISLDLPQIKVATNSSQNLSSNNTSSDKIISFKMGSFKLTMTQPANGNFDYMDSIRLYLSTASQTEVLAAHKYGIAKGQKSIQLDCDTTVDYKAYFLSDSLVVRMGAHFVGTPDTSAKLELNPIFNLTANPLK